MNKENILTYYQQFPTFNPKDVLSGKARMVLEPIQRVLNALGNPQDACQIIHVAGTNGKGSTISFLHQILEENGYRTGVFTSPMVHHFTEQIQINHQDITLEDLACYTNKVEEKRKECACYLSSFETLVCASYLYFFEKHCDFVIMEVGLGGKDDATNVMKQSLVSVIASISFDHMELLGNTLEKITTVKSGIIKEKSCVVSSQQTNEVKEVLKKVCQDKKSELHFVGEVERKIQSLNGQEFSYRNENYSISVLGTYQIYNASLALEVCHVLQSKGITLDYAKTKHALMQTLWPYRFEIVSKKPTIILDGSHNIDGISTLKESLKTYYPNQKIQFIIGLLADKSYDQMLETILPLASKVYCVKPDNPRALSAEELKKVVEKYQAQATVSSLEEAIDSCQEGDISCVFGSLYYLGQAKEIIKNRLKLCNI